MGPSGILTVQYAIIKRLILEYKGNMTQQADIHLDLGTEVAVLNSQGVPISQVVLMAGFTVVVL